MASPAVSLAPATQVYPFTRARCLWGIHFCTKSEWNTKAAVALLINQACPRLPGLHSSSLPKAKCDTIE